MRIQKEGSIVLFRPDNEADGTWLADNVESLPWQWFGGALCVEHRYAGDLAAGMTADGIEVR